MVQNVYLPIIRVAKCLFLQYFGWLAYLPQAEAWGIRNGAKT